MSLPQHILSIDTDYPTVAAFPMWIYVVSGPDTAAVIDTCVPTTFDATVRPALAAAGREVTSISLIVNTHGHPDHFGGNASWIANNPSAQVAAPLADVPWVEDHDRHWAELWDGYPGILNYPDAVRKVILEDYCGSNTKVDVIVRDGWTVDLGGSIRMRAVRTGGHSPDHTAYFEESSGVLFCGDVVQGSGAPFLSGGIELAPLYQDVEAYRTGLEALLATDFQQLVPAHHPPLDATAGRDLIRASLAYVSAVDALVDDFDDGGGLIDVTDLAREIGTRLGAFGGVTLQTAAVADAHLRQRARAGALKAVWRRA